MPGRKPSRAHLEAEMALLKSQNAQLLALLEMAPALVTVTEGPEHTFSYVNSAVRERLNSRDVIGLAYREGVPELADQASHEALDQVYGSGLSVSGRETPRVMPAEGDQQEGYFDFVHVPLADAEGNVTGVASLAVDVTERYHARQRVMRLGAELTDDAQTIARLGDELAELRKSSVRTIAQHQRTESELRAELERTKQLMDRLEREAFERSSELSEERALASRLIEHAPAGIAYLDRNQVFRWVNPRFLELFRMSREDVEGHSFSETFPSAQMHFEPALVTVLEKGESQYARAVPFVFGLDGAERKTFWDIAYHPVAGPNGLDDGVLFFALDVTARVENDALQRSEIAALQQADTLRDALMNVISHELRTPIHVLLGFGAILQKEIAGGLSATQCSYLQKMLGSAQVLADLVNDILDLGQVRAGTLSLSPRLIDFTEVLDAAVMSYERAIAAKRLKFEIKRSSEPPLLIADEQRIFQLIAKLLDNAIKFTPEGGSITLRVRCEGTRMVWEVEDSGIGMPATEVARLFEPISQLDMGLTRAARGCGMGLALSKAFVEAHGGTIDVESEQGKGTVLRVSLPMLDQNPYLTMPLHAAP